MKSCNFKDDKMNIVLLLVLIHALSYAESLETDDQSSSSFGISPVALGFIAIVCATTTIVLCLGLRSFFAKLCPDSTFKDLENDDTFFSDIAISTVPPVSFPMYPPVVNTPHDAPVYFEPLPDLSQRNRARSASDWSNLGRVRPKMALLPYPRPSLGRMDSTTEEEIAGKFDVETRKKIEKIFSSSVTATFPRSQLQYIKEMGNGWFGKVLQGEAHDIQPGKKKTKVVVLMLREGVGSMERSLFLQEGLVYRDIDNVNILKMFCQCVETSPLLTIYEFCQHGDLKSFMLNRKSNIEELTRQGTQLNMLCDIAAGLQCLHLHEYVHRDLAIRNCLVAGDLSVKIGDYGLAEQNYREDYYHDHEGTGIPIRWMSPESLSVSEALKVNSVTKEANIWTFGIVMWELLRCGDLPYSDLNDLHVLRLVAKERVVKPIKPNVSIDNIDHLHELMEMCWKYEPGERPSIRELRIMLLHLLSNKHQANLDFFEEKWNQLKPRTVSASTEESSGAFATPKRPSQEQYPVDGLYAKHQESRGFPANHKQEAEVTVHGHQIVGETSGEDPTLRSFPLLAPLGTVVNKELSLADELNASAISGGHFGDLPIDEGGGESNFTGQQKQGDEDAKSDFSHLTGTDDGFEIVERKRDDDNVSSEKDKFSFIHADEDFAEPNSGAASRYSDAHISGSKGVIISSTPLANKGDRTEMSRSPARPNNFVDLPHSTGESSSMAGTPGGWSDPAGGGARGSAFSIGMDEFSPMAPLSDSSLLKMDKYTNYLHTAVTSMEIDESFSDMSRSKATLDSSLTDSELK